jgi:hypothetical protein
MSLNLSEEAGHDAARLYLLVPGTELGLNSKY